jgi:hypothetical protein
MTAPQRPLGLVAFPRRPLLDPAPFADVSMRHDVDTPQPLPWEYFAWPFKDTCLLLNGQICLSLGICAGKLCECDLGAVLPLAKESGTMLSKSIVRIVLEGAYSVASLDRLRPPKDSA